MKFLNLFLRGRFIFLLSLSWFFVFEAVGQTREGIEDAEEEEEINCKDLPADFRSYNEAVKSLLGSFKESILNANNFLKSIETFSEKDRTQIRKLRRELSKVEIVSIGIETTLSDKSSKDLPADFESYDATVKLLLNSFKKSISNVNNFLRDIKIFSEKDIAQLRELQTELSEVEIDFIDIETTLSDKSSCIFFTLDEYSRDNKPKDKTEEGK